ncbi:MAG TPA: YdcF family protein, partial [Planctomycetota bacterium]|nr:YdcF family protein [Planctomycetota bacterium]
FSGGRGRLTRDWPEPEAVAFARRASLLGLPDAAVLVEPDSTNTGENLRRSAALLEARGLSPRRWILVHKPYVERRVRATAARQVPEIEAYVTSPPVEYEEWPSPRFPWPLLLRSLVGTLERMIDYPRKGFQMPEPIPRAVLEAGRALALRGYSDSAASVLFDRGAPTT